VLSSWIENVSKYDYFVGLLIAVLVLGAPVGVAWSAECPVMGRGHNHQCCSAAPEPVDTGCCSNDAPSNAESESCLCSHAPETTSGYLPAVASPSPQPLVGQAPEDDFTPCVGETFDWPVDDFRQRPPGWGAAVFLLDCAFLI